MSVITYKCKNCGGELIFKPEKQEFVCEYCLSAFTESELQEPAPEETNTKPAEEITDDTSKQTEDSAVYNCPSCGAEVVTDGTTAATFCYYCHNPVVLQGRLDGEFLPNRIIPFKIDKKSATQKFMEWIGKKHFVPKDFYSAEQVEKMTGIYFPYWLVDSDSNSQMSAKGCTVRTWTTGKSQYTETSHYMLNREGEIHLEDVIKNALKKANKKLVETVQPFDAKDLQKFSMSYLSGFQAEKRDIERTALEAEVNADIKKFCEQLLQDSMSGYSSISTVSKNTVIKNIAWEYSLLPVWTLTYKYKDEIYYFAMNGQTGKTCGKLPVNMKKLLAVAGAIAFGVFAIASIGGYLI